MTIALSAARPRDPRLVRIARTLSLTLLVFALVFLMGEGLPTAYSLQTHPLQSACFFFMLLGLTVGTRFPLDGGITTLLAWAGYMLTAHGRLAGPLAAFLAVALVDLAAGWAARRASRPA